MLPIVAAAQTAGAPLELETKIPLGAVSGRIDHLAVDLKRQQLFVAELDNDSLGVVNLAARKMQSTMPGLKEPQGIGYEPSTDTVYVANAGDGSVRLLWRKI
jgi:DNA-binding beta-propeller fold protein YncE